MEQIKDIQELSVEEAISTLESSKEGLSKDEVEKRFSSFGPNEIQEKRITPLYVKLLKQFFNFFAILLWVASGLSFLGEYLAPGEGNINLGIALVVVIFINAFFTFYQEYKAERAAEALKKLLAPTAIVLRNNKEEEISANQVVVGDVIVLKEGDKVPADARLLEQYELKVNNAPLTGESVSLKRSVDPFKGSILEAKNVVFSGTTIVSGSGKAIVFAVGMGTEFGKIAGLTQEIKEDPTPLQKEISYFIKYISLIAILLGVTFFLVGWSLGNTFTANFIFGIGIIVANVPEGLLPTVTLTLSIAAQKMAKKNALIKSLNSVETLGSTTVICTDKTGTLTQNEMTVKKVFVNDQEYDVSGVGYKPEGKLQLDGKDIEEKEIESIIPLLKTSFFCNDSKITFNENKHSIIGDPTEGALLVLAKKIIDTDATCQLEERIFVIPFTSDRKMMSTIYKGEKTIAYVKGSPESIIGLSNKILKNGKEIDLTHQDKKNLHDKAEDFEKKALRTLALAYREVSEKQSYNSEEVEKDLVLLGFVGMIDPPRIGVKEAVKKCKEAGIKVVMITGDNKLTAEAIGRSVGIIEGGSPVVVEGSEVSKMDTEELKSLLTNPEIIFARSSPKNKLDIVMALKQMGEVVAVTGDGVNDAPALKEADIGVSMGTGTDVAKEAADVILIDDNFKSIVEAVLEGRAVYDNIRKFVSYILVSNVPEIVPFIVYVLFRVPLALTVIQILAIDLGTDMLPAIALGTEPAEIDTMQRPPRSRKDRLLTVPLILKSYGLVGPIEAAAGLFGFWWVLKEGGWTWGAQLAFTDPLYLKATTMCLTAIIICQIVNVMGCRSLRNSVFKMGFFKNKYIFLGIASEIILIIAFTNIPFFKTFLGTASIEPELILLILPFALMIFVVDELRKYLMPKLGLKEI
ncbi:MAG: cation-transporting P-type ATPase [Candidatus Methanofastidiosum sp.]|nr:cation-transporting P-type ATPase [Methanofastidiosum sp.]